MGILNTSGASYDPLSFHTAIAACKYGPSLLARIRSSLEYALLYFISVLPILLTVLLPVLSIVYRATTVLFLTAVFSAYVLGFLIHNLRLFPSKQKTPVTSRLVENVQNVVVIGAGPAGLAAVKECLAENLSVTCYEKSTDLGGVYLYPNPNPGGVWEGVRLTSSVWITAFSDFPPEKKEDKFWTHYEYHQYLSFYADHFKLKPHIFFKHTVNNVSKDSNGIWHIQVTKPDGTSISRTADAVIVCSGTHQHPKPISLPGLSSFQGTVRHIAECKDPSAFVGEKVLIAGNGESATDFSACVSRHAAKTYLSIRRGKFIIPRFLPGSGRPVDQTTSRIRYALPIRARNLFMGWIHARHAHVLNSKDRVRAITHHMSVQSGLGPTSQLATKSEEFAKAVVEGRLDVRKKVVALDGKYVVYEDGVREEIDIVVYAHGYNQSFPFIDMKVPHPGQMYLRMFTAHENTLAFCGFIRPAAGSIPPLSEIQARYIVMVLAGKRGLPSEKEMEMSVQEQIREAEDYFPTVEQPSTAVNYVLYMDAIADLIGCRPNPWKVIQNPLLLFRLATGPVNGAMYRIHGTGGKKIADDVTKGIKLAHTADEVLMFFGLYFWCWPLALISNDQNWKTHNTLI